MICLQFGHHCDLGLFQISSQTVQAVLYFFQPRLVDTFPEQQLPIVKVVALQVLFLQNPLMGDHLSTDPANQLKLQSSVFLPFAPVFVDPFSNRSILIHLMLLMSCKVITIKVIIVITSEPMRKDTISCILLLQKFIIIISSIS